MLRRRSRYVTGHDEHADELNEKETKAYGGYPIGLLKKDMCGGLKDSRCEKGEGKPAQEWPRGFRRGRAQNYGGVHW
jgi:hypothetical protein